MPTSHGLIPDVGPGINVSNIPSARIRTVKPVSLLNTSTTVFPPLTVEKGPTTSVGLRSVRLTVDKASSKPARPLSNGSLPCPIFSPSLLRSRLALTAGKLSTPESVRSRFPTPRILKIRPPCHGSYLGVQIIPPQNRYQNRDRLQVPQFFSVLLLRERDHLAQFPTSSNSGTQLVFLDLSPFA